MSDTPCHPQGDQLTQTKYFGETDYACIKCGYDLRATPLGGTCPECGLPVKASKARIRVEDGKLIIQDGAVLPPRCIKTNQEFAPNTKTTKLTYITPWVYLLIFVNVLVLLVVYLIVRKRVEITYSISNEARQKIWLKTGITVTVGVAMTLLGFVVTVHPSKDVAIYGILLIICGIIVALVGAALSNTVSLRKSVNKEEYILKGCCPEFIDQIRRESGL